MSRARIPMQPPKEEPDEPEEEDEELDDEFDEEGMDMSEVFSNLLATEEGETIAEIARRQADAAEKIALSLEMQNKILVKILSALTKAPSVPVTQVADSA